MKPNGPLLPNRDEPIEDRSGLAPNIVVAVDDEPEILRAIERDLKETCQIKCFTSPFEALDFVANHRVSVVMSDLKMPEIGGLEFLSKCSEVQPQAGRMVVTAFADLVDATDSVNKAKISRIISKPWEKSVLVEAVEFLIFQNNLQEENQILRKQALTDGLTGLANNRYFWQRLKSEFSRAKRFNRPLSLIICDADNFKALNDLKGHPAGDRALIDIAKVLLSGRRITDLVARYGGEEFGLILPETTPDQARDTANRILSDLKEKSLLTLSFGVASFPNPQVLQAEDLVKFADSALLNAKRLGKARVIVWSENS